MIIKEQSLLNNLIAIKKITKNNKSYWEFRCKLCNNKRTIRVDKIRKKSCCHCIYEVKQNSAYGILKAIKFIKKSKKGNIWLFECLLCNKKIEKLETEVKKGRSSSCTCMIGNNYNEEKRTKKRNKNIKKWKNKKYYSVTLLENLNIIKRNCYVWSAKCDCGRIFNVIPGQVKSGHVKTCGKCNLLINDRPDLINEWNFEKNKDIDIKQICSKSNKKYWWKCKKCKKEWIASPCSRIEYRKNCPICHNAMSSSETMTKQILDYNNIKYEQQKTFNECKLIKKLRFDFYLPDYNLCIELNGAQHYRKVFKWNYDLIQKRDKTKEIFCKKNNIDLLIIPYTMFSKTKIKDIINKKINERN